MTSAQSSTVLTAVPLAGAANVEPARVAILRHALAALCQDGFNTPFARIARDAGVSPALIHYHFGSRDGLWAALADQITVDIRARLDTIRFAGEGLGAADMFRLMMRSIGDYFVRNPPVAIALYEVMRDGGATMDHLVDAFWRSASDFLRVVLAEAAGGADRQPFTFEQALVAMLGSIQHAVVGEALYRKVADTDTSSPGFLRAQIEFVIDSMMLRLAAAAQEGR